MDYLPPSQAETLRARSGAILGTVVQRGGARIVLRDRQGRVLGSYDGRATYDRKGRLVGYGNLLATLFGVR
ncbi:hypothetical protein JNW90_16050 [Micromonospora sp. STR1s_5]|nr:hypothetical protein [Micromonospora sp. STR1s_5]